MNVSRLFLIFGVITLSASCTDGGKSASQPLVSQSLVPQSKPLAWVLDTGLCEPETIIHDKAADRLVVSNICGFSKNGKGYLSALNMDGTLETPRWMDGLDAPAGMAIHGRRLYVTDLDKVQIIDMDAGKVTEVLGPYSDAKAFNDIAVDADGTVYVSDSARHKVMRIKSGKPQPFPDGNTKFNFANGLHIDGTRLYVGGEKLWSVDLRTGQIKEKTFKGLADIDGIETDGHGGLTVSIVGGDVWHLPAQKDPVIWTTSGLSSTNHAYLPKHNLVLVPTGYDNTVIAFRASP